MYEKYARRHTTTHDTHLSNTKPFFLYFPLYNTCKRITYYNGPNGPFHGRNGHSQIVDCVANDRVQ